MVLRCCVPGCNNRYKKPADALHIVSFHRIPRRRNREKWLSTLYKFGVAEAEVTETATVCEAHFKPSNFFMAGSKKVLIKNTVPSVFYPTPPLRARNDQIRGLEHKENVEPNNVVRAEVTHQTVTQSESTEESTIDLLKTLALLRKQFDDYKKAAVLELQKKSQEVALINDKNNNSNKMVQALKDEIMYLKEVNVSISKTIIPRPIFDIEICKVCDDKIVYYTGFPCYQIFQDVFNFILPSGDLDHLNLCSPQKNKQHMFKVSAENQFLITLIKIRLNLGHKLLADMFKISPSTVSNIFQCWINLMYVRLGSLQIWPHRDLILENAPQVYLEKYPNVIGSIDCTEFFIESPSSLINQSQCYSHYKGSTTMKSLVMTDPNGAFLYFSPLFTGSISDKEICITSGFVEIVKKKVLKGELNLNDTILADKGFNIADIFNEFNININIPVFRVNGQQFSLEDVVLTRTIAQERIHVERGIGRLKSFKILSSNIPVSLFGSIEQIYTVCCLLCNFRRSLKKKPVEE